MAQKESSNEEKVMGPWCYGCDHMDVDRIGPPTTFKCLIEGKQEKCTRSPAGKDEGVGRG
jgi:hypothetical protein